MVKRRWIYGTEQRSATFLMVAGAGGFLCLLVAGIFVYSNIRRVDSVKEKVARTRQIIGSLQRASQLTERIEFETRLYAWNKDPAEFEGVRASAFELLALPVHLDSLIVDETAHRLNADLTTRTEELTRQVQELPINGVLPREALMRCRETLRQMSSREDELLKQRQQNSRHRYQVSLATDRTFVALSLLTVAILVVLLIRDSMRRREFEEQIVLTNQELTDSVQALEDAAYQTRLLTSCSDELQLCVAVEQTYDSAADYLSRLLSCSSGSLCMLDPTTNMVEVVSYWGRTALVIGETFALDSCCGLRLGQLRWRRPGVSEIECAHFPATVPTRYFCVPMVAQGDTLGLLCVECMDDAACTLVEQRMKKLRQLLQITAMAIASLNLRKKLENQAIRDALTGVFNRHFMEVVLHRELAVASRKHSPLAVFMIDVDHFKAFNDNFGHTAGDAMLKAIADVFQVNVRTEDTVCRYGGEEFAIILPGISQEVAQLRAELIRHAVTRLRVGLPNGMMGEATVSIGIALFSDEAPTVEALLFKADQALYRAKNNGRNQVALHELLTAAA